jgi:hypothetical protein
VQKHALGAACRTRQRHASKWTPDSGAVIIHVPLPGIRCAIVDESGMETVRGGVPEQERNGVAGNGAVTNSLSIKGAGASVVEPEAGVLPAAGISPEQDHGLVRRPAVGRALPRHLVHLDVLTAEHPLERHVMNGLLVRDGPAKHPMPDEPVEERVSGKRLSRKTTRGKKENDAEPRRLSHESLQHGCHLTALHERLERAASTFSPSWMSIAPRGLPASCFKELQGLFHERLVVLEDAPMPGILIEDEFGVRKAARQVDRVAAGHHLVVITIRHQNRVVNTQQIGRTLTPPGVYGLQLGDKRRDRNRLVAVFGALFQP